MIAWGAPAALAGMLLLAGPLLVHMLVRRHARRVVFPSTRFLLETQAAAVRFRRPSDASLLLLRGAICAAAVLAAAQPIVVNRWRIAGWNARVARAIVLDTSRSMPAPAEAARLADRERQAFASALFQEQELDAGIGRAAEWLARSPPARRELVIVSDFQRGALTAQSLARLSPEIGVRFIRAGTQPATRTAPLPIVAGWRNAEWQPTVTLHGDALDAQWTRLGVRGSSAAHLTPWISTRQPQALADASARAVAAAVSFGVTAGDVRQRAIVVFAGAQSGTAERTIATPWIARAAMSLRESGLLRESGAQVTLAEESGAFLVHTDAAADSAAAPAVVRSVILAIRPADRADTELETATLSDAQLAAWRRDPGRAAVRPGIPLGASGDGRWLWAAALLLMAAEAWVRRRYSSGVEREVRANAA